MSASILKLLGDGHVISNASWLGPGTSSQSLPVNALSSHVLCERHNSILSESENCALVFCREVLQVLSKQPGSRSTRTVEADGDGLELWLLKTICGAMASGALTEKGLTIKKRPPRKWLGILFEREPWDKLTGLYVLKTQLSPHQGYTLGPIYDINEAWIGGGIDFAGIHLFVLFESTLEIMDQSSKVIKPLIYRPAAFRFESRLQKTEIKLRWRNWSPIERIRYHIN